jgi:hypothetical protein
MYYQYFTIESADKFLSSDLLKVSIPNKINDPFELLPMYVKTKDPLIIKEQALTPRVAKSLLKIFKRDNNFVRIFGEVDMEHWPIFVEKNIHTIYNFYNTNIETIISNHLKSILDEISIKVGLICLTCKKDSILMWSHYAKNHTGIVIGFNNIDLWDKAKKVNYSNTRVPIKVGFEIIDEKELDQVLYTKSNAWEYEDEFRRCVLLKNCIPINNEFFIPFQKEYISEIYFGINCDEINTSRILRFLGNNVKAYKAKYHLTNYQIDFQKIDF